VVELDVGAIAGNGEREADAAGGGNRKQEGGAAVSIARGRPASRLTENSDSPEGWRRGCRCRGAAKRTRAVAGVEDSHAGGERNFRGVGAESFAFELDGAEDVVVGDAEFQIGALEDVGKRRSSELFPGRLARARRRLYSSRERVTLPVGEGEIQGSFERTRNREREQ